jgi:hypothetical protein
MVNHLGVAGLDRVLDHYTGVRILYCQCFQPVCIYKAIKINNEHVCIQKARCSNHLLDHEKYLLLLNECLNFENIFHAENISCTCKEN